MAVTVPVLADVVGAEQRRAEEALASLRLHHDPDPLDEAVVEYAAMHCAPGLVVPLPAGSPQARRVPGPPLVRRLLVVPE